MSSQLGIEQCLSFINSQLSNGKTRDIVEAPGRIRAVTISRQAGCGALAVAEKLAEYLQARIPPEQPPWTVFDRNLVERVLEDHHLPQRLAKFMPENQASEISDTIDELCGLHPPSWLLVRQTVETILRLAKLGNVIIIGRGANIITANLKSVFHVRLVASLEARVRHIEEKDRLDRKAALEFIHREDNDPLLYHLIINTDLINYERAARLIADAPMQKRLEPRITVAAGD